MTRWARSPFALSAALAAAACGGVGEAHDDGPTLPPVVDDSCARFGFGFTAGGCPEAECAAPLCACPDPIRCISGMNDRCMTAVDCKVACAADAETLFVCSVSIEPCTSDAECGGEVCVTEPGSSNGECESGERGARCRNDADCHDGHCVAGTGGNRACSPGAGTDLCNRNQDCLGGRCVFETDPRVGECG